MTSLPPEKGPYGLILLRSFEVYANYAKKDGRRVAIIEPSDKAWKAKLEEDMVDDNKKRHQAPVYHGHSASGNVTGPLVYANYGSRDDFKYLKEKGVGVEGAIVLVRYYGTLLNPSLKVKAAELAGAAGCIIYSGNSQISTTLRYGIQTNVVS